jgi:hypothetical protein
MPAELLLLLLLLLLLRLLLLLVVVMAHRQRKSTVLLLKAGCSRSLPLGWHQHQQQGRPLACLTGGTPG